ncbi:MAG: hypothetical protein QHC67_02020 [Sphingobium sp.]|uniref:hypothetical protein n=1 Tax=Sphingobium sp. TaxID=1912891 RepID=UPI0029B2D1F1|nr:hypothetical protein [Sphingobium sp.]MDX3908583.1 hypothetical protein [Sphingobium sp.]
MPSCEFEYLEKWNHQKWLLSAILTTATSGENVTGTPCGKTFNASLGLKAELRPPKGQTAVEQAAKIPINPETETE